MTNTVFLLPSAYGPVALSAEELNAALSRGREVLPAALVGPLASEPKEDASPASRELLSAAQMAERTGVPESWWAAAAREGTVPCVRLGRWTRFDFDDVLAAAKAGRISRLAPEAVPELKAARRLRVAK